MPAQTLMYFIIFASIWAKLRMFSTGHGQNGSTH